MNLKCFQVCFITGKKEVVWAVNFVEAEILAQAEQIKAGNQYYTKVILNITDNTEKWIVE